MKKMKFLTFILCTMVALTVSAQGGITEPGATEPNSLATTTYDNPIGPNQAPSGPHRIGGGADNPGEGPAEGSPVGAPWVLLGFAAAYAAYRLVRRKAAKD